MKYIKYTIIAFSLLLSVSCSGLLDKYPENAVSKDNITAEDVKLLFTGLYNFSQYKPTFNGYMINDIIGGDLTTGSGTTYDSPATLVRAVVSETGGIVTGPYNGYYAGLFQINSFIEIVNKLEKSEENLEMLGVAHFFRALTYYNLVTLWREVPLIKDATDDPVPASPQSECWAFIEEDLEFALANTPNFYNKYYVSNAAVKALCARVMLAQDKMDEAKMYADEVITQADFELGEYESIFNDDPTKEVIFSYLNDIDENGIVFSGNFTFHYVPTSSSISLFTSSDDRTYVTIGNYEGKQFMSKYGSDKTTTDPIQVFRLAEMYLISAEAAGYPAGLVKLNELRAIRGLEPARATDQATFISAILQERQLELFCEGFRWFDLVRTGRLMSTLYLDEKYTVLPLPQRELDLNVELKQHPLWAE